MASLGQLARHERVARVEAGQPGEVGKGRVGGEDQDQRGGQLKDEEQRVTGGARSIHGLSDLSQHRLALVGHRKNVQAVGEV